MIRPELSADVIAKVTDACTDPVFVVVVEVASDIVMSYLRSLGNCGEMTESVVSLACGVAIATTVNVPPNVAAHLNEMGPLGAALRQAWADGAA